jgi:hypothetical protein
VLSQRDVRVGSDLSTECRLLVARNDAGPASTGPVGERAALALPLPPAALCAAGDAEGPFDFSRRQPGVLGGQQPLAEIERVFAGHAPQSAHR